MIELIKGKLIVSCQSWKDTPLFGPRFMRAMAECAQMGGAGGIRANGPDDIREIKSTVSLPLIGLYKLPDSRGNRIITPDYESAEALVRAGADAVAIDATFAARSDEAELGKLIRNIKSGLQVPVMADISTLEEAQRAESLGADLIATTMSGYTPYTQKTEGPDIALIDTIARRVDIPVVGEGRFSQPEEVSRAFDAGAHSVVIGTAITAPWAITSRFVQAIG